MAEKGWLLESVKGAFLKFKKIEPKKLKFSVDVLHKISIFDHKDTDLALEYRDYCQAVGWNFICFNFNNRHTYNYYDFYSKAN